MMPPLQKHTINAYVNAKQERDTAHRLQKHIAYETIGSANIDMRSQT
jgi:hypothetical protein